MAGKWLELLKEIAPRVNRAALLFNPATMWRPIANQNGIVFTTLHPLPGTNL